MSHRQPITTHARLLTLLVLGACAEPTVATPRVDRAPPPLPLQLQLPSDSSLGQGTFATESRTVLVNPPASAQAPSSVGLGEPGTLPSLYGQSPLLSNTRTNALLPTAVPGNAIIEGLASYFGNEADQLITINLSMDGTPLVSQSQRFSRANILPGWYSMHDMARVPISAACGHVLSGDTGHRAWTKVFSMSGTLLQLLQAADHSYSSPKRQADCIPERREESEPVPGGSGVDGRHQTDEWYLCTYEVWYNSRGEEISRRLMYCTQL